jgi:coenzyme F420-reducing hydrogenase delta subunit
VNAKRRVERIKELLNQIGLEPDRVRMFNMSSAMAGEFARAATEMSAHVIELGPNPLRGPDLMMSNGGSGTDDRDETAEG